jgi:hypothetical protein
LVPLSREEFLRIAGISSGAFDQLAHSDYVALAFGSTLPGSPGRYLSTDLVAIKLASELTQDFGRRNAADFVLGFFDVWADAVSRAEADPEMTYYFAIGALGPRNNPHEYVVTSGTIDEIARDFARVRGPLLFVRTDISGLLRRLREAGKAAGVDLSRPFFLPHGDPRYREMIADECAARKRRLQQNRKKLAAQKTRERRHDMRGIREQAQQ